MSDIRHELGDLLPIYEEYKEVLTSAPDGVTHTRYNPLVALDKGKEFEEITIVEQRLTQAGFATGSVRGLLAKCVEYEEDPTVEVDKGDLALIASFQKVPVEIRKKIRIMNDRYYYAGHFFSTRSEDE